MRLQSVLLVLVLWPALAFAGAGGPGDPVAGQLYYNGCATYSPILFNTNEIFQFSRSHASSVTAIGCRYADIPTATITTGASIQARSQVGNGISPGTVVCTGNDVAMAWVSTVGSSNVSVAAGAVNKIRETVAGSGTAGYDENLTICMEWQ